MPNSIGVNGLTVASQSELVSNFSTALQTIYGSGINIASDTPDGEWMNIIIQAVLDLEDLLVTINSMFDPDNAIGVILDQRVAYNGIVRQGGTYTVTPAAISSVGAVTLYGLDQVAKPVFTVSDGANQWQLQATQNIGVTGTNTFNFQAETIGAVQPTVNTITIPVTIVQGVTSINNPSVSGATIGANQESDAVLRIRRARSVSLASTGYYNGLQAALENVPGVTSAYIYENYTGSTDINGVPGHSVWVIVSGSASSANIAQAIYSKRNSGCGMVGAQTYIITQNDGTPFAIFYDVVSSQNLYIQFTAVAIKSGTNPNVAAILAQLPSKLVPGVAAEVDITELGTAVQSIDPNTLIINAGLGTTFGGTAYTLSPTYRNQQFVVSTPNIYILPVVLSPQFLSIPRGNTQQFSVAGGSQTGYTYSIVTNVSGGSINSSTGLYTAGSTVGVDKVQVSDSFGNLSNTLVSVI